jgi:NADH-quinone oxidoreductase subunit L
MADDPARGRYFGGLSIFMFSMLGIVLADNLIMIFVFWELVGFSSYMLIGHYLNSDEAAAASKKAFIVNRIGDLGFLVGIVYAYWHFGSTNLSEMGALRGG